MAHKDKKRLSAREIDVLQQIALGRRNREIATSLQISEQTVKVHVRVILLKLNARDRTHALIEGVRRGLVHIRAQ